MKTLKKRTLINFLQRRPQWLADAHAELDAAVAAAQYEFCPPTSPTTKRCATWPNATVGAEPPQTRRGCGARSPCNTNCCSSASGTVVQTRIDRDGSMSDDCP